MTLLDSRTLVRPLAVAELGVAAATLLGRGGAVGSPTLVTCRPGQLAEALAEVADVPGDVVVALAATDDDPTVLVTADRADPLVFRSTVDGEGRHRLAGLAFRFHDVVPVVADGEVLATALGHPVVVEQRIGERRIVVLGGITMLQDRWLPMASNAVLTDAVLRGGAGDRSVVALVRGLRPTAASSHPCPWTVTVGSDEADAVAALAAAAPGRDVPVDSDEFFRAVGRAGRLLPATVHDALVDFADHGHPAGALVIRGLPVGTVPATPASPRAATDKDRVSEFVLLAAGRRLGQPVGFRPEHGGDVVQNLVPTSGAAGAQTSTSSSVMLEFHTEAAFHPHRPRFLLLLGLRADPFGEARTLLCSLQAVLGSLTLGARAVLGQPRFRTSADESYTGGRNGRLGRLVPVLSGDLDRPTLTFDADLMVGVDATATAALQELRQLVHAHHIGVALGAGDLLVVDNHAAVHGRSPFRARYDGTDRWLQRGFVIADLGAANGERSRRRIDTRFTP